MMSELEIFNDDELDDLDDIAVLHDIEQLGQYLPRTPFQPRNRFNPIIDMQNEREFKLRFRFNKKSVEKLVQMVEPHLKFPTNKRGLPCTAEQIVCTGLELMAGGHFFRVAGYTTGVSTATAWRHLYR